ncbi:amidohydrolase family protein [Niallia sp. 03091]|uniref:amidohydrolase family protein n=1 Tax=Niallia sp. 03091 TaxID=3458059 RepID=UPI0040441EED
MFEKVIKNAQLPFQKDLLNIGIIDGVIASISTEQLIGKEEFDLDGNLLMPPFIEMHTHLDTVLTAGESTSNNSGTLSEAIEIWLKLKQSLREDDVKKRATAAIKMLMEYGVLHIRAAVDISDPNLTALTALLDLKKQLQPFVDLQVIAFPQDGLISCSANRERLIEAVKRGADAVSAVPHLEYTREDGVKSLEFAFSVAKEYGKDVHIFCDETDDEHSRFLEVVASITIKEQMEGRVAASHANALLYYSDAYAQKVMSLVKKAKLTIVCCPLINSTMQARMDAHPKGRGITRIKELTEEGINVCIAHDDIQTPFYPFGNGNILQAAHMAIHLAHMTGSEELTHIYHMITSNGADAFSIKETYGIKIGLPATFVSFPVKNIRDLFFRQPKCRYVFKNGEVLIETEPEKTKWTQSMI